MTLAKQVGNFIAKITCIVSIMYRNFFSLSELPFSISPDPKYLFMSDRHKEALSHLTYGLGEVGGFALLTGEVGTGKTTISRCLMEQLPTNTQAAFILNPTLSSQELLATLCDQLKIRYRKTDASLKILTDKISEKLLKNHQNDINTLLIIDEAQHLQPEVLEQLRLLTNLETNTKKLLQVILIGQPELQQLLQRRDLRQLAQRITARYHLMPLTKSELNQYISHRLLVADCTRALFDKGAIAKVHQLSQGVPRLTNLLCHSALMLAYNQNHSVVNKKTVIAAAERALGIDLPENNHKTTYQWVLVLSSVVSFCALLTLASFWWGQTQAPNTNVETVKSDIVKPEPIAEKVDSSLSDDSAGISSKNNEATNELAQQLPLSEADKSVDEKNPPTEKATVVASQPVIKATSKEVTTKTEKLPEQLTVSSAKKSQLSQEKEFTLSEIEGVSDDLLARFQAAIEATKYSEVDTSPIADDFNGEVTDNSPNEVKPLTQMSQQLQDALPSLQFEQHIYASDGQGWINVNGRDRYEGDYISDNLLVEKILPQQVILSFNGEKFSLPALTNW